MKYERLTHRNHGCIEEYCEETHCIYCDKDGDCHFDKKSKHIDVSFDCLYAMAERLAELEDKIEQGTLIDLPCKVGDIFYGIQGNDFFKYHIHAIKITEKGVLLETLYGMTFMFAEEAFLTFEEAEKRLKELQE